LPQVRCRRLRRRRHHPWIGQRRQEEMVHLATLQLRRVRGVTHTGDIQRRPPTQRQQRCLPAPQPTGGTPGYTVQLKQVHCDGLAYCGHSDRVGEAKIQCALRELHGRTSTDLTCVPHHRPSQGTGVMPLGLLPQAHQLGEGHWRPPGCPAPLDFATQAPLLPPLAMGRLPPSEPPRSRRWRGVGVRASPGARPPRRPRDSQGASGHAQGHRCLECRAHPEHQLLAGIGSWTTRWNAGLPGRQEGSEGGQTQRLITQKIWMHADGTT
jgi:hypothetical protein